MALIVKAYAARLRLDHGAFSGHSLRSGFFTSAAARGASLFKMMEREPTQVGRHSALLEMPMRFETMQERVLRGPN